MTGSVLALNIFFFVLSDAAYAVLIGCLLGIYWLTIGAAAGTEVAGARIVTLRFLRRVCLACVAGLITGQIVRPWFAAASMSGSTGFAGNLALVPDILSSTHAGKVWYIGSGALAALLAAGLIAGRQMNAGARGLFAVSLVLLGCAKAASGHAAGEGDFTLAEFSMLLHVGGTAVWAGTVVVSGLIVLPGLAKLRDPLALWSYARLLSRTVTWALLAIVVSGIYTSDRELNGILSGLWTSGWGRILLTKLAFVSLALGLGAITRFKCVKRPATGERAELMARLLRAEAFAMIVILCLSGLLANTPPAMTETPNARGLGQNSLLAQLFDADRSFFFPCDERGPVREAGQRGETAVVGDSYRSFRAGRKGFDALRVRPDYVGSF